MKIFLSALIFTTGMLVTGHETGQAHLTSRLLSRLADGSVLSFWRVLILAPQLAVSPVLHFSVCIQRRGLI